MNVRERVRALVDANWFQSSIITLILVNALVLGVDTSPGLVSEHGTLLQLVDSLVLAVFVVEIALRVFAHRADFFRDPWNWFDLVIVSVALLPTTGPFAVLRILRVLRVLRLLSVVPTLRHVVAGLLKALPGMAAIALLVSLLLYVAAVIATKLFRGISPEYFGDLFTSLITLFQIMTGDSWGEIAKTVTRHQPWAWFFFVGYILASTFIALNLFIAVAVEALEHETEEGAEGDATQQDQILAELQALRSEVARMRGPA